VRTVKLRPGVASALSSERDGYVRVHTQPTCPHHSNEPAVATGIMADKSPVPQAAFGSVQNLSHICSGNCGSGLVDLALIERAHVHVAFCRPCRACDVAQPRRCEVQA